MAKYEKYKPTQYSSGRPWEIHPVWRGIGCILMLLLPVLSYAGADLLLDENLRQGWVRVPAELARTVGVPGIGPVPHLYANLLLALVLAFLGFGLLVSFYTLVFRVLGAGPPKLGPQDAPPARRSRR
jgi:hypothetical protein